MKKLTFNKLSVILMYIMVIVMPVICVLIKDYPPDSLIYCWFGFWAIQAAITAKIRNEKRRTEKDKSIFDGLINYINEDNVDKVVEKYLGIDGLKKNNSSNKSKVEVQGDKANG
mgnify:CR=1 FL=1